MINAWPLLKGVIQIYRRSYSQYNSKWENQHREIIFETITKSTCNIPIIYVFWIGKTHKGTTLRRA